MDPQSQFCHNPACPDRGRGGRRIHSQKEQRYRCSICGQTFAATKGTPFYRLRGETDVVMRVLTLLCQWPLGLMSARWLAGKLVPAITANACMSLW